MNTLTKYIAPFALCGISPLVVALLLLRFGVNLPFMDQWELVPMITGAGEGGAGVFTGINEFLQFAPNCLLMILAWLTGWDVRMELWALLFSVVLTLVLLIQCLSKILPSGTQWRVWLPGVCSLLLFSLMQYENWFQGIQICYTLPALVLVWGLWVMFLELGPVYQILNGCLVGLIASFSGPHGLVVWGLLPLAAFFIRTDLSWRHAVVWGGCVFAFGLLYRELYSLSASSPTTPSFDLRAVIMHYSVIMGNPLLLAPWWRDLTMAISCAQVIGIALCFCCVGLIWVNRHERRVLGVALPLAGYALGVPALIAVGRASFGIEQALSPRYTTFSVWLLVAMVILLSCVRNRYAAFAVACIAGVVTASDVGYIGEARKLAFTRRQGRACLSFIESAPHPWCLEKLVYPDIAKLSERAQLLSRTGFLNPPVLTEEDSRRVSREAVQGGDFYGYLDGVTVAETGLVTATGWGWLAHRGEIADAVLLTVQPDEGEEVVFHLEIVTDKRPAKEWIRGFKKFIEDGTFAQISQWRSSLPMERVPCGKVTLRAYSYDVRDARAYQQRGYYAGEVRRCDG